MSNILKEQKLIDNQKRALIKYVFISDGTAEANTTLIDVSSLAYSLNANGYIMVSDTHQKSIYRTTIKRIFGSITSNGYISLKWSGTGPGLNNEIVVLGSGAFDLGFDVTGSTGAAAIFNPDEANSTGDIVFSTVANKVNDTFTLFVDIKKDNRDYDAGQSADPVAFNKGPAAGF